MLYLMLTGHVVWGQRRDFMLIRQESFIYKGIFIRLGWEDSILYCSQFIYILNIGEMNFLLIIATENE